MDQTVKINKRCADYNGVTSTGERQRLADDPMCDDPYFKCMNNNTNECVSVTNEPLPKCDIGKPDRYACANKWPDYPCYTNRRTCVNQEGIELVDPIGDIVITAAYGITDAYKMLSSWLSQEDVDTIENDQELQVRIFTTINGFAGSAHILPGRLESVRSAPIDNYLHVAQAHINSRQSGSRNRV